MKKIRNKKIDGRFYTDEYIDRLVKKIYQLEDRIDKAIEYIKNMDEDYCDYDGEMNYGQIGITEKRELLGILRGENNGNVN